MAKKNDVKEKKPAKKMKEVKEQKKVKEVKKVPEKTKASEKKEVKPTPAAPDVVRERKQSENKETKQESWAERAPAAQDKLPPTKTKWSPKNEKKQKNAKAAKLKEQKRERRQERVKEKKAKKVPPAVNQFWVTHLRPWCRRHYILVTSSISAVILLAALFLAKDTMDKQHQHRHRHPTVTDKVTFNVNINNETSGNLVLGLYGKACPLTVENFVKLSTHEVGFGYRGTKIHTIFPGHMLIGGDVVFNNGTGGRSAILENFEDENLKLRHLVPGTLGMVGLKNNTDSRKSSQFYITFGDASSFDGIAVVFGRIIEGLEFLKVIAQVDIDSKSMRPQKLIVIDDVRHQKV